MRLLQKLLAEAYVLILRVDQQISNLCFIGVDVFVGFFTKRRQDKQKIYIFRSVNTTTAAAFLP